MGIAPKRIPTAGSGEMHHRGSMGLTRHTDKTVVDGVLFVIYVMLFSIAIVDTGG